MKKILPKHIQLASQKNDPFALGMGCGVLLVLHLLLALFALGALFG